MVVVVVVAEAVVCVVEEGVFLYLDLLSWLRMGLCTPHVQSCVVSCDCHTALTSFDDHSI